MKQFALGVKVGRTKKSIFDEYWSKRIVLKLLGVYACTICLGGFGEASDFDEAPGS